ncbi:hypothetical protein PM10SUCC1_28990 [Propionigenium maris DSM 9537]|uniref:Uncharacterized protein n=1 Tax=Propionigenium maris DSM 9537 TaxID=1123000 RepID=A0A9W6GNJ4_9FUSO|nr:hypothetical protein PM10SUCC1_28990 [Propionigenium maris DSM 9537]
MNNHFFNLACELQKGSFLLNTSLKNFFNKTHLSKVNHLELLILQTLFYNSNINLYQLSNILGFTISQISSSISSLEDRKLVKKRIVNSSPLEYSLSLKDESFKILSEYRDYMTKTLLNSHLLTQKNINLNSIINDYSIIISKIEVIFYDTFI